MNDDFGEDWVSTWYSVGIVFKADVETIEKIKQYIGKQKNCKIIFSKVGVEDMYIQSKD